MRHARTTVPTVTDPVTGRTYPMIMGGSATDAPASAGDTDAGTEDDGAPDGAADDDGSDEGDDDGARAGGPEALRADLAKERQKRKAEREARIAAERALEEAKRGSETEIDRAKREAREAALGPARQAVRRTVVETAAKDLGFIDVADAIAAVDLDAIDVEEDDLTADREQAATLVRELAEAKPYLLTDAARERLTGGNKAPRGGADTRGGSGGGSVTGTPQDSFMGILRSARSGGR